jgi:hypothetical protein
LGTAIILVLGTLTDVAPDSPVVMTVVDLTLPRQEEIFKTLKRHHFLVRSESSLALTQHANCCFTSRPTMSHPSPLFHESTIYAPLLKEAVKSGHHNRSEESHRQSSS